MGNAVDFEKARRRRQRSITFRRMLLLILVMLFVAMLAVVNQVLVKENATTGISDLVASFGGNGYPAELPGGTIRDVGSIGKSLYVLNDASLYIYNQKAKMIQNIQRRNDQTIAIPGDSRVLTFSVGGKSFNVNSLSKEMFSQSLDFGILCADMNRRGDFAVVAPVKQFASKVYVYDRRFEEIYSWSTPEYVTNVSIAPKGDMMAVNCLSGEGGVIESQIYYFRFYEERETAEVALKLEDNMCMDIDFYETESVFVLTDRQYLLLNSVGEIKESYDFNGREILAKESNGLNALLLMKKQGANEQSIILLDEKLKEKAKIEIPGTIIDMALGKDEIYILNKEGIDMYDLSLEKKASHKQRGASDIHLIDGTLYYLTLSEIDRLSKTDFLPQTIKSDSKSAGSR